MDKHTTYEDGLKYRPDYEWPKPGSERQCPKYAAKLYDIGVEQLGMNGTDMYIVKLGNTGKKRWVKKD